MTQVLSIPESHSLDTACVHLTSWNFYQGIVEAVGPRLGQVLSFFQSEVVLYPMKPLKDSEFWISAYWKQEFLDGDSVAIMGIVVSVDISIVSVFSI